MPHSPDRVIIDKILVFFGIIATVALLAIGIITWVASDFINNQVRSELTSQQIYFPPKTSAALSPDEFPGLQKYAGQQVDNAAKAKAFANEFISKHLEEIGGGKTYAEVSNLAMADPGNKALQQQKTALFQGETLRGLLLNAYAFGTVGAIAGYAALISIVAGAAMLILVILGFLRLKSHKKITS